MRRTAAPRAAPAGSVARAQRGRMAPPARRAADPVWLRAGRRRVRARRAAVTGAAKAGRRVVEPKALPRESRDGPLAAPLAEERRGAMAKALRPAALPGRDGAPVAPGWQAEPGAVHRRSVREPAPGGAAWGARAAAVRPAARGVAGRAAGRPARPEPEPKAWAGAEPPEHAASAAGAVLAERRAVSAAAAHAGRAGLPEGRAGARAARGRDRRRPPMPGRAGCPMERGPGWPGRGRGPAGRFRPATSVSCALQFPLSVSTCGHQAAVGLNPR